MKRLVRAVPCLFFLQISSDDSTLLIQYLQGKLLKSFMFLELVLIIAFLVLTFTMISSQSYGVGSWFFIPIVLSMVFGIFFLPITMCWYIKVSTQALADLRKVCDDLSTKHQGISFHLRDEQVLYNSGGRVRAGSKNYIEGEYFSCWYDLHFVNNSFSESL